VDSAAYAGRPGMRRWSGPRPERAEAEDDAMENYSLTLRCRDQPGIVRALARAVRLYAEDRVVLAGARTVVFGCPEEPSGPGPRPSAAGARPASRLAAAAWNRAMSP
jgi:hypothetical protein